MPRRENGDLWKCYKGRNLAVLALYRDAFHHVISHLLPIKGVINRTAMTQHDAAKGTWKRYAQLVSTVMAAYR